MPIRLHFDFLRRSADIPGSSNSIDSGSHTADGRKVRVQLSRTRRIDRRVFRAYLPREARKRVCRIQHECRRNDIARPNRRGLAHVNRIATAFSHRRCCRGIAVGFGPGRFAVRTATGSTAARQYRDWSQKNWQQVTDERNASSDRRSFVVRENLGGVQTFTNPYGTSPPVELSMTNKYDWTDRQGRMVGTDDPSANPNAGSTSEWRKMERVVR